MSEKYFSWAKMTVYRQPRASVEASSILGCRGGAQRHRSWGCSATNANAERFEELCTAAIRISNDALVGFCTQVPLAEGTHLTSLPQEGQGAARAHGTAALHGVTPCPCPAKQLSSPQKAPHVTPCRRTGGPRCHSRLRSGINKCQSLPGLLAGFVCS